MLKHHIILHVYRVSCVSAFWWHLFFYFFAYADEQALQFGKYSTTLKKKRKPSKVPLKVFFFPLTLQNNVSSRQKKEKGESEYFLLFFFLNMISPSVSVSQEFHSGRCSRSLLHTLTVHLLTVPFCFCFFLNTVKSPVERLESFEFISSSDKRGPCVSCRWKPSWISRSQILQERALFHFIGRGGRESLEWQRWRNF